MDFTETINKFRDSVTAIILSQHDFIDWDSVNRNIENDRLAAEQLEKFRNHGELTAERLADALGDHPEIYNIALTLIAFTISGSQISKWGLAASVPPTISGREHIARQLLHIGLGRVLTGSAPIVDLLRISEVYKDSYRRRFRSGDRFSVEVRKSLHAALQRANSSLVNRLVIRGDTLSDTNLRRSLDYVISTNGRPIAGIATVFQNQSGGRQQRDLMFTYPSLQQKLSEYGIALILIADGQGMKEASERTLWQMFENVRHPMTLKQANNGALEIALVETALQPAPETLDAAAIARLITGALAARPAISANELPLATGPAVLALARYAEAHRELALTLSSTGQELAWTYPDLSEEARSLSIKFDDTQAIRLFTKRIGSEFETINHDRDFIWSIITTDDMPPFTGRILVVSCGSGLSSEIRRTMSRLALGHARGSSFAILLAARELSDQEIESHRKRQGVLPANIIVVGPWLLRRLAQAFNPRNVLTEAILNQSDLTKVSPFILSNATPFRMFFGRASEAATILGTVGTNSVALLGSRRIGKTSLLRWVRTELDEANFLSFFADCQTVKTWQDFAELVEVQWGIKVKSDFKPRHLAEIIRSLRAGSDKTVVILLDEIDQLLEWDRGHMEDSVPEAFFRECRALSQEGLAQFVFSGERTIAHRIWDPQSPHWNFCRPLPLSQLTREAATALLIRPIRQVGIIISDETSFGDEAWRFTSGHPQIVQYLGDKLVRRLDAKIDRKNLELKAEDIYAVAETYEFAEHYLNTYWGQATALEKEISLMVADNAISSPELIDRIKSKNLNFMDSHIQNSLRMLQLYGIISEEEGKICLRAAWFKDAQAYFGARNRLA